MDHDDFGLGQPKIIYVIQLNHMEHDVIAKVCQLWRILLWYCMRSDLQSTKQEIAESCPLLAPYE